jgi:hypothetical protein
MRWEVKIDPGYKTERVDIAQEKSHLAVRRLRVG